MLTKKINGFTLAELMVSLALTSIMVTLAYTGYNFTQKLLNQFNEQNTFFVQLNEINKRFNFLSQISTKVTKENDFKFLLESDSTKCILEFIPNAVLISKSGVTDTFHLETKELKYDFESMDNPNFQEQLIRAIDFDVLFQKETFHVVFTKQYDAYSKLILETQNN